MTFAILVGLFVAGLAVRQIAYILMHGSIFAPLRERIGLWMDEGNLLAEKLNELFTCKVCMTAQMAIWTVALPTTLSITLARHPLRTLLGNGLSWSSEVWLTLLAGFLLAMAVAAVAVGCWNLIEFLPNKQEAIRRRHEQELRQVRRDAIAALDEQQRSFDRQLAEISAGSTTQPTEGRAL